jgi:hypothetical protein
MTSGKLSDPEKVYFNLAIYQRGLDVEAHLTIMPNSTTPFVLLPLRLIHPVVSEIWQPAEAVIGLTAAWLKVLIADDSPVVAKVLSSILRRAGYEVVTAADGIEAAQAVYRELPDVVLLDIFMPRMNAIRSVASSNKTPMFRTSRFLSTPHPKAAARRFGVCTPAPTASCSKALHPKKCWMPSRASRGQAPVTRLPRGRFARSARPGRECCSKVCTLGDQNVDGDDG